MGLAVKRRKRLVDNRKNGQILTVSRKKKRKLHFKDLNVYAIAQKLSRI